MDGMLVMIVGLLLAVVIALHRPRGKETGAGVTTSKTSEGRR